MVTASPQGPVHTVFRKSHSNSTGYGAFGVLCITFDQGLSPPETLDPSDCSKTGRELTACLTGASNIFLLQCQLVFDFYLDLGKLLLSSASPRPFTSPPSDLDHSPQNFPAHMSASFLLSSSQDTCSPQIWIRYFSAWLTSPWGVQTPTRGLQTLDSLSLAFVSNSFNSMVTLRRGQLFAVCKPLSSVLAPFGLEGSDRSFSSPSGRDSFKGSCTWFHRVLLPFCPFARDP